MLRNINIKTDFVSFKTPFTGLTRCAHKHKKNKQTRRKQSVFNQKLAFTLSKSPFCLIFNVKYFFFNFIIAEIQY